MEKKKDALGDRMKEYENAYRVYLPRRLPVIVRVDGRAFHTFTQGFKKPFDHVFMRTMEDTAKALCESVAGCKFAYGQSGEISLLVTNNDSLETEPWFGNNLQKIVSVTSSVATKAFNHAFSQNIPYWNSHPMVHIKEPMYAEVVDSATFDCRAFVLPPHEVYNYFLWRLRDASRNSIQMLARSKFSHNELQGKNSLTLIDMLKSEGIIWDMLPSRERLGYSVVRKMETDDSIRPSWIIESKAPEFCSNQHYFESLLSPTKITKE